MTTFTAPQRGKIMVQSFFGPRIVDGIPGFHPGIDVTGDNPTGPLYSMHSGTIAAQWSYKSGAQNILVVSDDGTGILYSGLSKYNEKIPVGSPVAAGDEIGTAGNTDAGRYHTHIEVVTPQGVAKMGLTRGQDAGGNSVWLFNGKSLSDSTNAHLGQQYYLATRTGLPNNIKGDAYRQDVLIPGDVVVPWAQVSPNASAHLPQINKWSRATWNAANQLHPYLAETRWANQLFSAANSFNPPGLSPGQGRWRRFGKRRLARCRDRRIHANSSRARDWKNPDGIGGLTWFLFCSSVRDDFSQQSQATVGGEMRSYTKAMLAIADGAASSGKRFGNRGSVTAGRFGDTGFPILRALPGRLAARGGPTPTSVQGAAPATPAFQQNAACSPTSKLFGNFSNGSGLRWRSRMCILTATLIVSQLLFACICATAGSPQKPVHTANIIQEVDVDPSSSPVWCYDTEPAFVFSKDSTVFRYDASGKLVWQMSAPWEMGGIAAVSCSTDGKALYFTNNKRTRLSIYSPENGLSEYEMSVPKLRKPDPYSLMSADGNTLALPSTPSIISGKDVLRNKRVVQTDGAKVFWTKDILFVQAGENNRYRMLRISDLSDLGVLKLRPTPDVHGIFECGKTYFALYWTEQLQRRDLELINDRRLQPNGAPTRFDDVGAVDQSDDFCTVSLLRNVRGDEQLETVSILQDRFQERIDLRNIKRLASWLKVSRDRRFILGIQDLDRPTRALDPWTGQPKPNDTRRASRVVILSVAR